MSGGAAGAGTSPALASAVLAPVALVAVLVIVAGALAGPIVSGDLWWHLSTGRWILAHGELPETDPFSHTAGDTPWTLEEYGSQVGLALLERAGGLGLLRATGALLAVLLLLAVHRAARRRVPAAWAALATALFALLFALKWELRPHLLSAFFLLWIDRHLFPRTRGPELERPDHPERQRPDHPERQRPDHPERQRPDHPERQRPDHLERERPDHPELERLDHPELERLDHPELERLDHPELERRDDPAGGPARDPGLRRALAVLALAVVWTQLHAEAIFVPVLALAGLIGAVLGGLVEREGGWARVRAWAWVLGLGTLGTLATPEGFDQLRYALSESSVPRRFIEEWFPAWVLPGSARFAPLTLPLFAAAALSIAVGGGFVLAQALGRLAGRRAGKLAWERIGFLAVCVLMALLARRFFWLAWFPALDALAWWLERRPGLARRALPPAAAALACAVALVGTPYVAHAATALGEGRYADPRDPSEFPVHAARLAREAGLEGNLYHPYEWGGYLGFHLGSALPVFVDGRTVLFGDVIEERWWAERDAVAATETFARRDVRVVVFRRLVEEGGVARPWRPLDTAHLWVPVWKDATAAVWVRADDRANLERVRTHYDERGIELDPAVGFVEAAALAARPEWLEERDLLHPSVARALAPTYAEGVRDDPATALVRARLYAERNLGRSARFELVRHLRARHAGEPERLREALARLAREGPLPLLRELAREVAP